eukprot:scaffold819_cov350-Prasinococcus_capsulatus_cf.AAC.8
MTRGPHWVRRSVKPRPETRARPSAPASRRAARQPRGHAPQDAAAAADARASASLRMRRAPHAARRAWPGPVSPSVSPKPHPLRAWGASEGLAGSRRRPDSEGPDGHLMPLKQTNNNAFVWYTGGDLPSPSRAQLPHDDDDDDAARRCWGACVWCAGGRMRAAGGGAGPLSAARIDAQPAGGPAHREEGGRSSAARRLHAWHAASTPPPPGGAGEMG